MQANAQDKFQQTDDPVVLVESFNDDDKRLLRRHCAFHWALAGALAALALGATFWITIALYLTESISFVQWLVTTVFSACLLLLARIACATGTRYYRDLMAGNKSIVRGTVRAFERIWPQGYSTRTAPTCRWHIDQMIVDRNGNVEFGLRDANGRHLTAAGLRAIERVGASVEVQLTHSGMPFRFFATNNPS